MSKETITILATIASSVISLLAMMITITTKNKLLKIEKRIERKNTQLNDGIKSIETVIQSAANINTHLWVMSSKMEQGMSFTLNNMDDIVNIAKEAKIITDYAEIASLTWGESIADMCLQLAKEASTNLDLKNINQNNSPKNKIKTIKRIMDNLKLEVKKVYEQA